MGITKTDLEQAILNLDEKIAVRLNKHFYTKDAIDRKFDDQMHQIKLLFEDLKSNNLKLIHEKSDAQDSKIEDHEHRITKLEKTL